MNETCLLEVLIATYARPEFAIRAIKSVVAINDPRISVRCSSNRPEPALEEFCAEHPNVHFDSFEINLGPSKNVHKLVSESRGKFVMLLSDEDSLRPDLGPSFLQFLSELPNDCNVVSCAVYDKATENFYYHLGSEAHGLQVNLAGFTILSSTTYLSGYVWRRAPLQELDLAFLNGISKSQIDGPNFGLSHNVYAHIDTSQLLLITSTCTFYMEDFVQKGVAARTGGHAFSHREAETSNHEANLDLNPDVYGPYARVRQFFYRELILTNIREYFPALAYFVAEAQLYSFFFERLIHSLTTVHLDPGITLQSESERAITDAAAADHCSGSTLSKLFSESVLRTPDEAECSYNRMKALADHMPEGVLRSQLLVHRR